jgi:hypothetical protein
MADGKEFVINLVHARIEKEFIIVLIGVQTSKFYEFQLEVEMPANHANITMSKGGPTPTQIEGGVVT